MINMNIILIKNMTLIMNIMENMVTTTCVRMRVCAGEMKFYFTVCLSSVLFSNLVRTHGIDGVNGAAGKKPGEGGQAGSAGTAGKPGAAGKSGGTGGRGGAGGAGAPGAPGVAGGGTKSVNERKKRPSVSQPHLEHTA
jgi:hypothetical protein